MPLSIRNVAFESPYETHSSCNPNAKTTVVVHDNWAVSVDVRGRSGSENTLHIYSEDSAGDLKRHFLIEWLKVRRAEGGYGFLVVMRNHLTGEEVMDFISRDGAMQVEVRKNRTMFTVDGLSSGFDIGLRGTSASKRVHLDALDAPRGFDELCEPRASVDCSVFGVQTRQHSGTSTRSQHQ